jgi:osmoprotectant transport system permease protein
MYRALGTGEADVISAFSSDGRIAADRLTVLTDPRSAIPPYDAVILVSPKRARDRRLLEALQPLVGSITVEAIRSANYTVDRDTDKLTPAQAAQALRRP